MGLSDGILIAVIGVASSLAGAWLAGTAAVNAAREQAKASLSVTDAQLKASAKAARSAAALKLFEYRAEPLAEIYAANSRLQAASLEADMESAARALAVAAAAGAARLDGEAAKLCILVSEWANLFVNMPVEMLPNKAASRGELAMSINKLTVAYRKSQSSTLELILEDQTISDPN